MTTANSLISRALRLIGVLGQGRRTLTANESDDGLEALNSMMDALSVERMMVYQILEENFPLVIGTANYTIGTGGDFNTARPIRIENVFLRDSTNNDYPLMQVYNLAYDSIPLKTVTSRPQYFYYDPLYPMAYIRLMYVPAYADTIYINSWKQLESFTDGTTVLALPPGYERMIAYNLAVEISPEYQLEVRPDIMRIAKDSKAAIKRINALVPIADVSEASLNVRGGYGKRNIYTG